MTPEELEEIVDTVLHAIRTNSKTISQLTEVSTAGNSDYFELSGGRKMSFSNIKELILAGLSFASLNTQGALATGEEQRLVVEFINMEGQHIEVDSPGVFFNGSTNKIETYEKFGEGVLSVVQLVLSESPSQNVVYCDKLTNTLHRWNGTAMVQLSSGGGDYVPTSRTINGNNLSQDIVLNSGEIPYDSNLTVEEVLTALGNDKVNFTDIVQTTGQATKKVMSQKAVTDIIGNVESLLSTI